MIKKHKKLFVGIGIVLVLLIIGKIYFLGDNTNYKFKDIRPMTELTKKNYLEDFDYAYNTLKNYYPYFDINKEVFNVDWLSNYDEYKSRIEDCKADKEFFYCMKEILSDLNNDHTNIIDENLGVGYACLYSHSYRIDWRSSIFDLFKNDIVQARYNVTNKSMNEYKASINNEYKSSEEENLRMGKIEGNIAYIDIKNMDTPDEESSKFIKDKENLEKFLANNKNSKAMVIDIRDNGGGDSSYWMYFILPKIVDKNYSSFVYSFFKEGDLLKKVIANEKAKDIDYNEIKNFSRKTIDIVKNFDKYSKGEILVEQEKDSVNFKGNIYLLVNEKVYSSSEMLAVFAKESKLATLVGKKTGGDGIGSDPMSVALPNTGYIFRFPKQLGVTGKGSINEMDKTLPDYEVVDSNKNLYISNGEVVINDDQVIEKIIELENNLKKSLKLRGFCSLA